MLRRTRWVVNAYTTGVEQRFASQRLEQLRQQERIARSSSRYAVERKERTESGLPGTCIGIDLGTTNSCMTYIDAKSGKPKVIPSPSGSWVYPTAVTIDKNHTVRLCGEEARAVARTSASATLCSGKRLIGRRYGELGRVSTQMSKTNHLHVNERGEVSVEIQGRTYSVIHLTSIFLRHMKKMAEEYLMKPVDAAVVSVPAYFTPQQKVATEDAALIAGFDVLEIIDEPSAACLSYTLLRNKATLRDPNSAGELAEVETSLVFDLGGGTLDCAIMEHDKKADTYTLVATHGDPLLGGNDWDNVLANDIAEKWQRKWKIDIESPDNRFAGSVEHRILQLEAERAKVHFSHSLEDYHGYQRNFHFSEVRRDIIALEVNFTFQDYLRLTAPLRERCRHCLDRLMEESGKTPDQIHNILLVGAMTRDPPVRRDLEKYFGRMPTSVDECPPDYAVAIGAGVRAGMLCGMFPDMNEKTRFVRGSRQSLSQGGVVSRAINLLWSKLEQNPNAIGHKWRGVANGLPDAEIEKYAKEIVEFEASSDRRVLLDKVEGDANDAMQRVFKNNYKKQGMQEKVVKQLTDQLKFWQYMVRNFHDHEDHLARVVKELNTYMDEVEGRAADESDSLTPDGKIDFDKLRSQKAKVEAEMKQSALDTSMLMRQAEQKQSENESAGKENDLFKIMDALAEGTTPPGAPPQEDNAAPAMDEGKASRKKAGTKILRRNLPLPSTAHVDEIVEHGTPVLIPDKQLDYDISESTRQKLFADYVEDRAWREPPAPPGESGSWLEVKQQLDAGVPVGKPITAQDVEGANAAKPAPIDMAELVERLAYLREAYPVVLGATEEESTRCVTMKVVERIKFPPPPAPAAPAAPATAVKPAAAAAAASGPAAAAPATA